MDFAWQVLELIDVTESDSRICFLLWLYGRGGLSVVADVSTLHFSLGAVRDHSDHLLSDLRTDPSIYSEE